MLANNEYQAGAFVAHGAVMVNFMPLECSTALYLYVQLRSTELSFFLSIGAKIKIRHL